MKRTPMKRSTKRMAPRSKKGRAQVQVWVEERDEHLKVEPDCRGPKVGLPGECSGRRDVHHIQPRGMGGRRGPAGPKATLCRRHHDWVETHRAEARALGLLMRRN